MGKKPQEKKAKVSPAGADLALVDQSAGNECTDHLCRIHEALKTIRGHSVFDGIDGARPLSISQGGHQTPFDKKDAVSALSKGEGAFYLCGGNFLWADQIWLANHRVPINSGQVQDIQKNFLPALSPPKAFSFTVTVAVETADEAGSETRGFQRLSPPEPTHALLFSVAEAVKKGADAGVLKAWKHLLLTTSFRFEVVPVGEPRYWRAANLREEAVNKGLMVTMTVRQRIYDIAGFKAAKDAQRDSPLTADQVAKMYEKLKLNAKAEPITKSFVECAVNVHKKLLCVDATRNLLAWCDRAFLYKNPWDSVYTLNSLCDRAPGAATVTFALHGLVDGFRMGFLDKGVFVSTKLRDPRLSRTLSSFSRVV